MRLLRRPQMTRIEPYRRVDGRFGWRLVHRNGEILATDGGQGYENFADMVAVMHTVFRHRITSADLRIYHQE